MLANIYSVGGSLKYLPYYITYSYSISDSLNGLNLKSVLYSYDETGRYDFSTLNKDNKLGWIFC